MTIQEIKAAILAGKKVCCGASGYIVSLDPDWISPISTGLKQTFIGNGYTVGVQLSELEDCFIYGE